MLGMTHPAIRGAWYQASRRTLDLMFSSGRHYRYSNVPAEVAEQFARAESKGRFYNREIRGHFACAQLDAELEAAA